jgi:hypothetical protein
MTDSTYEIDVCGFRGCSKGGATVRGRRGIIITFIGVQPATTLDEFDSLPIIEQAAEFMLPRGAKITKVRRTA